MRFAELVDLDELRRLCESFTALTGAVTAILDLEGTVLIATGWQDVCTRYHRVHPVSASRCLESDTVLAGRLREGEGWNVYQCRNGLVDVAVPIHVGGHHLANFFTGQFLFEPPDRGRFERQAAELGLDREAYLAAVDRVPVFTEAHVRKLMDFLVRLAAVFGEMGLARRQLELAVEQVRASEERFALAMEASRDGVWDWDVPSGAFSASPGCAGMLGLGAPPPLASAWLALVHPEDRARVEQATQGCIEGRAERFELELRLRHRDGGWRTVLDRGSAVARDGAGRALRVVGTRSDVTERRAAEERARRLEAQLAQASKMESVGRLAGGVAHDFNNMLGVILGQAELALLDLPEGQPGHQELQEIRRAARRSADLTRQLLGFARKQVMKPRLLDLNETVGGMLEMLRRLIGEHVELAWQPGSGLWTARIDPSQVDQILANLCVNARDAIEARPREGLGRITVETRNEVVDPASGRSGAGEHVALVVRDDGCGLDEEAMAHLFEPFFTTKPIGRGTGLGLATVLGIVQQNGGFIEVSSEPGRGTSITVLLPRQEGERARPPPGPAAVRRGAGELVLLVEDEPSVLEMARRMLEHLGYRVLAAGTPGEGLRLAAAHAGELRLLVTDVVMPEMNGRELAERVGEACPGIRCLFTSGYTASIIEQRGVLGEGLQFIPKPFTMEVLGAMVGAALAG